MTYDGLDVTTIGTLMPADHPDATGAFTLDAGGTIRNTLRQTVYVEAADVTPETIVSVKRFRLVPGATASLPAPQGVWLVAWVTQLRVEWTIGWLFGGTVLLWGLAGWGAGDIVGRVWDSARG
ncbi:hypothetical protein [Thiomonas sp.]